MFSCKIIRKSLAHEKSVSRFPSAYFTLLCLGYAPSFTVPAFGARVILDPLACRSGLWMTNVFVQDHPKKNCSESGSYYSGSAYVAERRTEVRRKGKRAGGPALFRCRLSRFFFCAFALLYDGRDLAVFCTSAGGVPPLLRQGSAHQRSSLRTMAAPFAARAMAAMPFLAASLER